MSSTMVKKKKWIMTNKYEMKRRSANVDEVSYTVCTSQWTHWLL